MAHLTPYIPDPQEEHWLSLWTRNERYRFYVEQRRANCTFMERMDLWLLAPQCEDCACAEPFPVGLPDIHHDGWEVDILLHVGSQTLDRIQQGLAEDSEFALQCKECGRELRPWDDDNAYVVSYHLEEHYGIPLETPGQMFPSERLREKIFSLYDSHCFGCGASDRELHIDHIRPRSKGGDAAFRNLQPLCEVCGNRKGDTDSTEVEVYSTIYFGPYPADSYEGLFW
jgi:5-methylcytosine-specific restriction endonuclease McrA